MSQPPSPESGEVPGITSTVLAAVVRDGGGALLAAAGVDDAGFSLSVSGAASSGAGFAVFGARFMLTDTAAEEVTVTLDWVQTTGTTRAAASVVSFVAGPAHGLALTPLAPLADACAEAEVRVGVVDGFGNAVVGLAAALPIEVGVATDGAVPAVLTATGLDSSDALPAESISALLQPSTSAWSWFLGVDVALIGVLGYGAILGVSLWGAQPSRAWSAAPTLALLALVVPAVLFTVRLKWAEWVVLKTFCPWCLESAVTIVLCLVLALLDLRRVRLAPEYPPQ